MVSPVTLSSVRVAGGEEHDGHPHAVAAQPAGDLEAVEVGEHDVEHDELGPEGGGGRDRRPPGGGHGDVEARVAQGGAHQVGDGVLVVDDQHPGRSNRDDSERSTIQWC